MYFEDGSKSSLEFSLFHHLFSGLLDVPICSVNDDGYFANPRYSLNFPPSQFDNQKLKNWKGQIPVSAINVNSQLHPINTITGLQYFTGLNSYPYREKAIPRVGLGKFMLPYSSPFLLFSHQSGFIIISPTICQSISPYRLALFAALSLRP